MSASYVNLARPLCLSRFYRFLTSRGCALATESFYATVHIIPQVVEIIYSMYVLNDTQLSRYPTRCVSAAAIDFLAPGTRPSPITSIVVTIGKGCVNPITSRV